MSVSEWLKILSFSCSKQRPRSFQPVNKIFHLQSLGMKTNPPWMCLPLLLEENSHCSSSCKLHLPKFAYFSRQITESSSITSKHFGIQSSIPIAHSKNREFERQWQDLHACSLVPANYDVATASPATKRTSWKSRVSVKLCSSWSEGFFWGRLARCATATFATFRNEMEEDGLQFSNIFRVSVFVSVLLLYPTILCITVWGKKVGKNATWRILKPILDYKINPRSGLLITWHSLLTVSNRWEKWKLESIVIKNKIKSCGIK